MGNKRSKLSTTVDIPTLTDIIHYFSRDFNLLHVPNELIKLIHSYYFYVVPIQFDIYPKSSFNILQEGKVIKGCTGNKNASSGHETIICSNGFTSNGQFTIKNHQKNPGYRIVVGLTPVYEGVDLHHWPWSVKWGVSQSCTSYWWSSTGQIWKMQANKRVQIFGDATIDNSVKCVYKVVLDMENRNITCIGNGEVKYVIKDIIKAKIWYPAIGMIYPKTEKYHLEILDDFEDESV